jgi:alcohol dehydrogenase class IV
VARELQGEVSGDRLVALGGGRVIDVAKALASAGGVRAMAVPTTLSGAEMTASHRVIADAPRVRPAVVICDPALAASQPEAELAASALNALGHAFEAPCTVRANPVSTLAAHEAARRLHGAFGRPPEIDRDGLALGALLAGYALGSTGIGLHHVLAQTLVRVAGVGHGDANAVLLPQTVGALTWRAPEAMQAMAVALGDDPAAAATRVASHTRASHLGDLGVDPSTLVEAARAAAGRDELEQTPPRAEEPEIKAIYEAAL